MKVKTMPFLMFVAVLLGVLQGCVSLQRLPAVPADSLTRADVLGIPNARFFVDDDLSPYLKEVMAALDREKTFLAKSGHGGEMPPANFLALSGGGDDGAFGAGLLVGWTQSGTRPQFKLVTGISTGALIAPFAFLGPDYDHLLKELYTGIGPKDIYVTRSILSVITSDALSDNTPLWNLLRKLVNRDMLNEIAAEYEKGRILLIGTTNLDSRRPVIWNMGAIASSRDPRALDLFDSILLASAAIPGVFPPVMIPVEINGKPFEEMHVDGGATAQVFVYPPSIMNLARSQHIKTDIRERNLYVIRNGRLDPEWASVDRRLLPIAGRAISSLIHSQGVGDLFRIYMVAKRDGVDYNLAYIGPEFKTVHKEDFDNVYMKALFEYSFDLARNGYPWKKTPPFLESSKPSLLDLSD
ncbi:MAG: patatin-like phospholipase family protein [Syntrophobacteraceae bacterium]